MNPLATYRQYKEYAEAKKLLEAKTEDEKIVTPEGYMLWTNVPMARTGIQLYARGEIQGLEDKNGVIQVMRDEGEVFDKASLASYIGKPIVNDHPTEGVTNANWHKHARGVVLNAYKKQGDNKYLYGDVLITDKKLQEIIEAGKCQLSVGYDAKYEQTAPGFASQRDIYVNHLAVVDRGRAGSFCRIGDSYQFVEDADAMVVDYLKMTVDQRAMELGMLEKLETKDDAINARIAALNKIKGGSAAGESMEKELLEKLLLTMDAMNQKLDKLSVVTNDKGSKDAEEKPATDEKEDEEDDKKSKDKKSKDKKSKDDVNDEDKPTVDDYAKVKLFLESVPEKVTLDHKKQAVVIAMADKTIASALNGIITNVTTADALTINAALAVASALQKQANNARTGVKHPHINTKDMDTLASMNKSNVEFWKKKGE